MPGPKKGAKYRPRQPKPSPDLEDARWVANHPDEATDSPTRKGLQGLFRDDFKGFLARKDRLEAQYLSQFGRSKGAGEEPATVPNGTVEPDAGSERVEGLIQKLLKEMESP